MADRRIVIVTSVNVITHTHPHFLDSSIAKCGPRIIAGFSSSIWICLACSECVTVELRTERCRRRQCMHTIQRYAITTPHRVLFANRTDTVITALFELLLPICRPELSGQSISKSKRTSAGRRWFEWPFDEMIGL